MKISFTEMNKDRKPEPPNDKVADCVELARAIFAKHGLEETQLTRKASAVFGRILVDVGNNSLATWRNGRPNFETEYAEASKGCLLIGSVGTGKSTAMKIMAHRLDAEYLSVPELAVIFSRLGEDVLWSHVNRAERWDLFLDDLGAEKELKSFSNLFPIEEVIYKRYDLWQRCGARLHVSTNLSGEQIQERYGLRVRDRMKEMMTVIPCTGRSMRK